MEGMEVEFQVVHVTYPLWFKLAVLGTLLFIPLGVWLARRSRYPAVVCLLPVVANLAVVFTGLSRVAKGMSLGGWGKGAAAVGCAEAQFPLLLGAGVTLFLSGLLIVRPARSSSESATEIRWIAFVDVLAGVFVAGEICAANWLVAPGHTFAQAPADLLRYASYAAALSCLITIIVTAPRAPVSERQETARGGALFVFASAAVLFTIAYYFSRSLRFIALGIDT